jgi:hypothetical protein
MTEQQGDYVTTQEVEEGLAMFWQDKPKEIPSALSGFTPAPDILIKKYGYVTALIWGRVWRYCQGPEGYCYAKLETIAGELKMSVRNVIRHIKKLCADGYLEDTTPNYRNTPHIYRDPGKLRIRIIADVEHKDGMTQSHGSMTGSHGQSDSESLEERYKKQSKKLIDKERLDTFKGCFGKFLNVKELKRWDILYEASGKDRAEELVAWAFKKEIHLTNRSSLLDSLETAAKNWKGKEKPVEPNRVDRPEYQPVPEDPNRGNYVPRPANIPRPNIKAAPAVSD